MAIRRDAELNPRDAGATSSSSRRFEPVETAAVGWRLNHFVLQVGKIERGRVRHVRPTGQIRALLQHKIRRRNDPGNDEIAVRWRNVQRRRGSGI